MRSHKGERRALWVAAVHSPAPAWNLVGAVEDLASLVLHARRGGLDVIDIEIVEPEGRRHRFIGSCCTRRPLEASTDSISNFQ